MVSCTHIIPLAAAFACIFSIFGSHFNLKLRLQLFAAPPFVGLPGRAPLFSDHDSWLHCLLLLAPYSTAHRSPRDAANHVCVACHSTSALQLCMDRWPLGFYMAKMQPGGACRSRTERASEASEASEASRLVRIIGRAHGRHSSRY